MILLLLIIAPLDDQVARDRVSLIEHNEFYDQEARPVFKQFLFWNWSERHGRYDLIDWKLDKGTYHVTRDYRTGRYVLRMQDGDTTREIWAEQYKETLTQHDPELVARDVTPVNERKKLSQLRRYERTPKGELGVP